MQSVVTDENQIEDMLAQMEDTLAPTHPHPETATTDPELRAALGPVQGVFDRARDAARELTSA